MDTLDARVSAALVQLQALEAALHSPHSLWEIEVDGLRSQAERTVYGDGVRFEAPFDELPPVGRTISLLRDGAELLVAPYYRPLCGGESLVWDVRLGEEPARV